MGNKISGKVVLTNEGIINLRRIPSLIKNQRGDM